MIKKLKKEVIFLLICTFSISLSFAKVQFKTKKIQYKDNIKSFEVRVPLISEAYDVDEIYYEIYDIFGSVVIEKTFNEDHLCSKIKGTTKDSKPLINGVYFIASKLKGENWPIMTTRIQINN